MLCGVEGWSPLCCAGCGSGMYRGWWGRGEQTLNSAVCGLGGLQSGLELSVRGHMDKMIPISQFSIITTAYLKPPVPSGVPCALPPHSWWIRNRDSPWQLCFSASSCSRVLFVYLCGSLPLSPTYLKGSLSPMCPCCLS